MYVVALSPRHFSSNLDLLSAMFRLRRRVFKDRLDWTVSVSGDLELDVYDALNPTYLVLVYGDREVVGCVRLLPTTGPTMLAETFPELLGGKQAPRSKRILESSRFCVDTSLAAGGVENGLNRATFTLFAAMIEGLDLLDADSIVTVTDTRMERILRRARWPLERIAPALRIGNTMALAGFLHGSGETLATMYGHAGVEGPVLRHPDLTVAAAQPSTPFKLVDEMLADPRHSRVVLINPSRGKPAAVSAEFAARWTESLSLLEAVHDIFDVGVNVIGEHDPAQWSKLLVSTIKPLDGDGLSLWREERFTATISTSDAGIIFIGGVWLDEEVFITALQGVRLGYDVRLLADLSICRIEADRSLVLDRLAAHGVLTTTLRQALLEWAVCLDDPMLTKRVRELLP